MEGGREGEEKGEGREGRGRRRTLSSVPGAEADGRALGANGLNDRVDDLEAEAGAVLDAATILVRAVVRDVLKELEARVHQQHYPLS